MVHTPKHTHKISFVYSAYNKSNAGSFQLNALSLLDEITVWLLCSTLSILTLPNLFSLLFVLMFCYIFTKGQYSILTKHIDRLKDRITHNQWTGFFLVGWNSWMVLMRWKWFFLRPAPFSIKHTLDENSIRSFDGALCGKHENMYTDGVLASCHIVWYVFDRSYAIVASAHSWAYPREMRRLEKDNSNAL